MEKNILPGKGLEDLRFGMTKEQVTEQFGKPDETETYKLEGEEEYNVEAWHYDILEMSLTFEEEFDYRLTSIAASSDEFTIEDGIAIGKDKERIIDMMQEVDWLPLEFEKEGQPSDENDFDTITVSDKNVHFWFDADILSEIQWSVYWDEDESPIWSNK